MPPPTTTELRTFQIEGVGHDGDTLDTWFVEAPTSDQALSRLSEKLADRAELAGWCYYTLQYCADIRITEASAELAANPASFHIPLLGAA